MPVTVSNVAKMMRTRHLIGCLCLTWVKDIGTWMHVYMWNLYADKHLLSFCFLVF